MNDKLKLGLMFIFAVVVCSSIALVTISGTAYKMNNCLNQTDNVTISLNQIKDEMIPNEIESEIDNLTISYLTITEKNLGLRVC